MDKRLLEKATYCTLYTIICLLLLYSTFYPVLVIIWQNGLARYDVSKFRLMEKQNEVFYVTKHTQPAQLGNASFCCYLWLRIPEVGKDIPAFYQDEEAGIITTNFVRAMQTINAVSTEEIYQKQDCSKNFKYGTRMQGNMNCQSWQYLTHFHID